jgi:hypothetical protein
MQQTGPLDSNSPEGAAFGSQPELMRHEIDLICSHLERSVKS